MIAEIHNKMSDGKMNRKARSEDELTGNVFGNLRYLPYSKGFKKVLAGCAICISRCSKKENT